MSVSPREVTEIAPCSGVAFVVPAGSRLHVTDPCGQQVADLVFFAAHDTREVLSNGRTFDYASSLRLSTGDVLYSNRSTPLATIVRDDVGTHDFLLTPCSRDTWRLCYDDPGDERPGCMGNLAMALASYGITSDMIPTAFNCFMNVRISPDGALAVLPPRSRPGDTISFQAHIDVIAGLTACSAPLSNNGAYKPIRYALDGS